MNIKIAAFTVSQKYINNSPSISLLLESGTDLNRFFKLYNWYFVDNHYNTGSLRNIMYAI